jgi:hypothetical protein
MNYTMAFILVWLGFMLGFFVAALMAAGRDDE